jgi:hypothetical protein
LQSIARTKAGELEAATAKDREAKAAAAKRGAEAAGTARALRATEDNVARTEAALKEAEKRLEALAAQPPEQARGLQQAEAAKAKAAARLAELQATRDKARAQAQAREAAAQQANEEARIAAVAKEEAARAAEEAARKTQPVSVFVSRKTQRLYVRKGNYPIYEGPVTIKNAQSPIGTFVFTAASQLGSTGELRWSAVAMYPNPLDIKPIAQEAPRRIAQRDNDGPGRQPPRRSAARSAEPAPTDVQAAKAALDRIVFSKEALEAISDVVLVGSSLIVSDEGPSRETGKDTDFVVVMSGEPQGALKIRQREPLPTDGFGGRRSPFGGGFPFFWN